MAHENAGLTYLAHLVPHKSASYSSQDVDGLCTWTLSANQKAPVQATSPPKQFSIFVQIILLPFGSKDCVQLSVDGASKVAELKREIERLKEIRASKITMYCNKRLVPNSQTFCDAGIGPNSVLSMYVQVSKGSEFLFEYLYLEPHFDYDFTSVKPNPGERYIRGGFKYQRPYGWYRVALKVTGVYEDDSWLGLGGIREGSTPGEWPVAYHGTKKKNVNSILKYGFFAGKRQQFGWGVYTSPSLEAAAKHAPSFVHTDGDSYQVVIQVRVNPAPGHLKRIDKSQTYYKAEYWLSNKQNPDVSQRDVRPYGILLRKISQTKLLF